MATILVVDDQIELRTLFQRVLEHGGHRVVAVAGGEEALRSTESWKPDLVLLDMAMPDMDGQAFLRAIRSRDGWQNVPVIVLSGMLTPQQIAAAGELNVCDYLVKGEFTTRQLRARIARHLTPTPPHSKCNAA